MFPLLVPLSGWTGPAVPGSAAPSPTVPDLGVIDALTSDPSSTPGALLGILAVLALIDSTSFGTLLIPVWLLLAPGRLRGGRILVYLGVVAGAYALIGLALLSALLLVGDRLLDWVSQAQEAPVLLAGQAALAAALIWYSCRLDPFTQAGKEKKRRRDEARGRAGRIARFRERAVGQSAGDQGAGGRGAGGRGAVEQRVGGGVVPLMGLALAAVALEIATLLPYLAGIGLVAAEDPGVPAAPAMILFYCAVMITPALVLLTGRLVARRALQGPLHRLEQFLSRHADGTIALILFLVGLFLGVDALEGLQIIG